MEGLKKYLVTKVETVTVWATDEDAAQDCALEHLAWGQPDTEDLQVEEVD